MNRKWIILWVAAVAAGLAAFGVTRHALYGRSEPSLDCLQDVTFLSRELHLSDAQANEIRNLHMALGARLNDCCRRHCAARARLGTALAAETNGTVQADALVAEMCRAYEESERAALNQIRQVRAVLNAEQRKRFDALITDCVCGKYGMPGGNGRSCVE